METYLDYMSALANVARTARDSAKETPKAKLEAGSMTEAQRSAHARKTESRLHSLEILSACRL
ncbi:MAG: hypothetical protein PW734_07705 [Verrucomicrobium sp.]|nr:hypothetical protein [Verrucomicrobium sp.]